jgi:hypothetical protein
MYLAAVGMKGFTRPRPVVQYNAQQFILRVLGQGDEQTAADGKPGPAGNPQLRKYTGTPGPDGQYGPIAIHLTVRLLDQPATAAQDHPGDPKSLQAPLQER